MLLLRPPLLLTASRTTEIEPIEPFALSLCLSVLCVQKRKESPLLLDLSNIFSSTVSAFIKKHRSLTSSHRSHHHHHLHCCAPRQRAMSNSGGFLSDVFATFDECALNAVANVNQRYHTHALWLSDTAAQQRSLL
jgi:hypothetical protein